MMELKQEIRNTKHAGAARIAKLEDFHAWQEAILLAEAVYKLTASFPAHERYALSSQLQRAVVSVSANLAEGFGRQASKDKEHFYVIARGSLYETKSLLVIAKRLSYVQDDQEVAVQLQKTLNYIGALLRTHRSGQ